MILKELESKDCLPISFRKKNYVKINKSKLVINKYIYSKPKIKKKTLKLVKKHSTYKQNKSRTGYKDRFFGGQHYRWLVFFLSSKHDARLSQLS